MKSWNMTIRWERADHCAVDPIQRCPATWYLKQFEAWVIFDNLHLYVSTAPSVISDLVVDNLVRSVSYVTSSWMKVHPALQASRRHPLTSDVMRVSSSCAAKSWRRRSWAIVCFMSWPGKINESDSLDLHEYVWKRSSRGNKSHTLSGCICSYMWGVKIFNPHPLKARQLSNLVWAGRTGI